MVKRKKKEEELTDLEKKVLGKMSTLIMSGIGFVTALAWNDAIRLSFQKIFGDQEEVWAKYIYAIILTIIVVIVGLQLDRISKRIEKEKKESKK